MSYEEKFCQITSESFHSEEQLVKFHSPRLQWVAITACSSSSNTQHLMPIFVKMYSERVNMCVTLYLCMCIFLELWLLVCWKGG